MLYDKDFLASKQKAEVLGAAMRDGSNRRLRSTSYAEPQILGDWFPEEPRG